MGSVLHVLAGMSRLPYRIFLPWNVAGGLAWAPAVVLAGYAAGDSYQQVHRLIGQGSLALAGVVAVLIVVAWGCAGAVGLPPATPAVTTHAAAGPPVRIILSRRRCVPAGSPPMWSREGRNAC